MFTMPKVLAVSTVPKFFWGNKFIKLVGGLYSDSPQYERLPEGLKEQFLSGGPEDDSTFKSYHGVTVDWLKYLKKNGIGMNDVASKDDRLFMYNRQFLEQQPIDKIATAQKALGMFFMLHKWADKDNPADEGVVRDLVKEVSTRLRQRSDDSPVDKGAIVEKVNLAESFVQAVGGLYSKNPQYKKWWTEPERAQFLLNFRAYRSEGTLKSYNKHVIEWLEFLEKKGIEVAKAGNVEVSQFIGEQPVESKFEAQQTLVEFFRLRGWRRNNPARDSLVKAQIKGVPRVNQKQAPPAKKKEKVAENKPRQTPEERINEIGLSMWFREQMAEERRELKALGLYKRERQPMVPDANTGKDSWGEKLVQLVGGLYSDNPEYAIWWTEAKKNRFLGLISETTFKEYHKLTVEWLNRLKFVKEMEGVVNDDPEIVDISAAETVYKPAMMQFLGMGACQPESIKTRHDVLLLFFRLHGRRRNNPALDWMIRQIVKGGKKMAYVSAVESQSCPEKESKQPENDNHFDDTFASLLEKQKKEAPTVATPSV